MKSLSHQTQMGLASFASTVAVALLVIGFMGMAQQFVDRMVRVDTDACLLYTSDAADE